MKALFKVQAFPANMNILVLHELLFFRCMNDGAGEVAFVKQSIVLGEDDHDAKYELLCPGKPLRLVLQ